MLKQRVLTALILAPLGIAAVLWLPPREFQFLIALIFGLAAWEWCQFIGIRAVATRGMVGATMTLLLVVLLLVTPESDNTLISAMGVVFWLFGALWLKWREFGSTHTLVTDLTKTLFGLATLIVGALAITRLIAADVERGWLIALLFIVWGADVGAYFAGRFLGRNKLAPNISPNKTWEGVWGGQLVVVIICVVAAYQFELDLVRTAILIFAGLMTAAISVVGDLLISLMKRQEGLKDAGRIFPGHGGVLDRFDSLIAAAPVFALCYQLLQL